MTEEEYYGLIRQINMAFTPGAPISSRDLFAGRKKEVQRVIATIFQPGQHVVLFGERGVGKTSLAQTLFDFIFLTGNSNYHVARTSYGQGMSFRDIWESLFKQVTFDENDSTSTLDGALADDPNSQNIKETLQLMNYPSVFIIDEFDRLDDEEIETLMADTIKTISDNAATIRTTIVLVGVADSVDQLMQIHPSNERGIVQILMPRMSKPELLQIVDNGLGRCANLTVDPTVRNRLADLAHGLPTYTHLLARESATAAVTAGHTHISMSDLQSAIKEAVNAHLGTNLTAYTNAVATAKGLIFKSVLLACALAKKDDKGFFYAKDVVAPLNRITAKEYAIPAFARHLKAFSSEDRGQILQMDGRRYRFSKPIMEPYIILRGLADGTISENQLSQRSELASEPVQLSLLYPSASLELGLPL